MAYTHVKFIAYEVPTIGTDNADQLLDIQPGNLPANYAQGLPAAINNVSNEDARKRVAVFYSVLERARRRVVQLIDSATTLKIFMAPEFYFRPVTAASAANLPAYTLQEYREIKTALRALIAGRDYNNWLVIPGTIMWYGAGKIGKRPDTNRDDVFFNSSLYITVIGGASESKVIEKTYASTIDCIPTGRHGGGFAGNLAFRATDEAYGWYATEAKQRKHVFTFNGVHIGLEICLEHGMQLLKNVLSDAENWQEAGARKSISLQLLTAGGMPVDVDSVAVVNNGYIFRNDGIGSNDPCANVRKVLGYKGPVRVNNKRVMGASTYGGPDSKADLDVTAVPSTITPLDASLKRPDPGFPDGFFTQQLRIYTRRPLP